MKKITSCSAISPAINLGDSPIKSSLNDLKALGSSRSRYSPKIGDFSIIRPLGRGMFGQVYLAMYFLYNLVILRQVLSVQLKLLPKIL